MKLHLSAFLLVLGFVIAIPTTQAQEKAPASAAASKKSKTDLEKAMSTIGRANRQLKKQIADASKNASSLELVAKMREGAEASVKLIPAKAQDLPASERDAFTSKYQASMKDFLAGVAKLEADLKANNNAAAQVYLKNLNDQEKDGHKSYRRPEKE